MVVRVEPEARMAEAWVERRESLAWEKTVLRAEGTWIILKEGERAVARRWGGFGRGIGRLGARFDRGRRRRGRALCRESA